MHKYVKGDTEIRTSLRSEANQLRAQGFKAVNDAPLETALKEDWVAYAVDTLGANADDVSKLKKDELVAKFGPASEPDAEPDAEPERSPSDDGKDLDNAGEDLDNGGDLAQGTKTVTNTTGAPETVTGSPRSRSASKS